MKAEGIRIFAPFILAKRSNFTKILKAHTSLPYFILKKV